MTVDILHHRRLGAAAYSEAATIPHPDEVVDEAVTRDEQEGETSSSSRAEENNDAENNSVRGRGVYAMIELGASNKPRYRLDKIQSYLYTTSGNVRRAEDGGYRLKKRAASVDTERRADELEGSRRCNSTSSSLSSGGIRRKINGALKVVQRCKDAVQSGIRFRELRDGSSVTSSGSR